MIILLIMLLLSMNTYVFGADKGYTPERFTDQVYIPKAYLGPAVFLLTNKYNETKRLLERNDHHNLNEQHKYLTLANTMFELIDPQVIALYIEYGFSPTSRSAASGETLLMQLTKYPKQDLVQKAYFLMQKLSSEQIIPFLQIKSNNRNIFDIINQEKKGKESVTINATQHSLQDTNAAAFTYFVDPSSASTNLSSLKAFLVTQLRNATKLINAQPSITDRMRDMLKNQVNTRITASLSELQSLLNHDYISEEFTILKLSLSAPSPHTSPLIDRINTSQETNQQTECALCLEAVTNEHCITTQCCEIIVHNECLEQKKECHFCSSVLWNK